nr:MAG TPA: hypothetical protein [Caudoviricetes sp.]
MRRDGERTADADPGAPPGAAGRGLRGAAGRGDGGLPARLHQRKAGRHRALHPDPG